MPYLAESLEDVLRQMTYASGETRTFSRFLDKFKILDQIPWTEDILDKAIKDVSDYVQHNGIDHAWIDFSINKYMGIGWHKHEAIKFFYERFRAHAPGKISLVLALKYEYPQSGQRIYSSLINRDDIKSWLIGIDLVGDEAYFDAKFYGKILRDWHDNKKMVRAHVGESQSIINVSDAIRQLNVTNIAHGIKIVGDDNAIDMAKDSNVTFDLCISSNYYTGVISDGEEHPIKAMYSHGLPITLGSDDPIQFNTTLLSEYELSHRILGDAKAVDQIKQTAFKSFKRFST
jgi:adenosine deaminase